MYETILYNINRFGMEFWTTSTTLFGWFEAGLGAGGYLSTHLKTEHMHDLVFPLQQQTSLAVKITPLATNAYGVRQPPDTHRLLPVPIYNISWSKVSYNVPKNYKSVNVFLNFCLELFVRCERPDHITSEPKDVIFLNCYF